MNNEQEEIDNMRLEFLLKYWKMTLLVVVISAVAITVGIMVLLSVVASAVVPEFLGQWSVGTMINFCLTLAFWEIVFVFTWVIPVIVGIYFWYTKLPEEDHRGWKPSGRRESGDAIGFLIAMSWLLMIWIDGRWDLTFNEWTLNAWIISWLTAAGWDLLIFGIPAIIIIIMWFVFKKTGEEF